MGNPFSKSYTTLKTGEVSGSITAKQLTDVPATIVRLRAHSNNAATVYFGGPGVTIPDGTSDETSGMPLSPGEISDAIFVDNLNKVYIIGTNATDDVHYMVMR